MKHGILFLALGVLFFGLSSCKKEPVPERDGKNRRTDFDVPVLTAANTISIIVDADAGYPVDITLRGGRIAVDWGDGSPMTKDIHPEEAATDEERYLRTQFDHTYARKGEYTIKIWSAELTFIEVQGYLTFNPDSKAGFAELRFGHCPVLATARFLSFSRTEALDFSGCPALDELLVWQWPRLKSIDLDGCPLSGEGVSVYGNPLLAALDLSGSHLKKLDCGSNALAELKLPESIEYLDCSDNRLLALDLKNRAALKVLLCADNPELASLDLAGCGELGRLSMSNTALGGFDFGAFPKLFDLGCAGLGLTSLDVTANPQLRMLECEGNELTALDLSRNPALFGINLTGNKFGKEALDAIFTALPSYRRTRLAMPPLQMPPTIRLIANPGAPTCNTAIATDKGWQVMNVN